MAFSAKPSAGRVPFRHRNHHLGGGRCRTNLWVSKKKQRQKGYSSWFLKKNSLYFYENRYKFFLQGKERKRTRKNRQRRSLEGSPFLRKSILERRLILTSYIFRKPRKSIGGMSSASKDKVSAVNWLWRRLNRPNSVNFYPIRTNRTANRFNRFLRITTVEMQAFISIYFLSTGVVWPPVTPVLSVMWLPFMCVSDVNVCG